MTPTALIKVIAALTPIMGDKEIGESMVTEIQTMFTAMQTASRALASIDAHLLGMHQRLNDISVKLQALKLPLSENEVETLLIEDYTADVAAAVELGERHYPEGIANGRDDNGSG